MPRINFISITLRKKLFVHPLYANTYTTTVFEGVDVPCDREQSTGLSPILIKSSLHKSSLQLYKRKFNGYPANLVFGIPDARKTNYQFLRRT